MALLWSTVAGVYVFPLADTVVIGRADTCDVVLPDPTISRRHARISRNGDGWCLEDLGSRNGTRLNGRALDARQRLTDGDRIAAGHSVLLVVEAGGAACGFSPSGPGAPLRFDAVLDSREER